MLGCISTVEQEAKDSYVGAQLCGDRQSLFSSRESPELKGLKCPRKRGTWLMSALAKHLTRRRNTRRDSKGTAGDLL